MAKRAASPCAPSRRGPDRKLDRTGDMVATRTFRHIGRGKVCSRNVSESSLGEHKDVGIARMADQVTRNGSRIRWFFQFPGRDARPTRPRGGETQNQSRSVILRQPARRGRARRLGRCFHLDAYAKTLGRARDRERLGPSSETWNVGICPPVWPMLATVPNTRTQSKVRTSVSPPTPSTARSTPRPEKSVASFERRNRFPGRGSDGRGRCRSPMQLCPCCRRCRLR